MNHRPDLPNNPARVLIVDNEPHNRHLLEVMLAPEGFHLLTASDGGEALAIVEHQAPDLILLDVMMPGIDGYEVVRQLKAKLSTKNIPIIMVSALDDREARITGLNVGAEDFLSRPVDRAELCARVRNLLRLKAYGDYYDQYSQMLEGEVASRTAALSERTQTLERQAVALTEQSALLDVAQDAIVVLDVDGRILFWNRGAEVTYGWLAGEALGKIAHELLKTQAAAPLEETQAEILREGRWEGEFVHYKHDGTPLNIASRWTLQSGVNGAPRRILTINNDISERKKEDSERLLLTERLSLATAAAKMGVWEWELSSNKVTWDATMFDIYGFPPIVPMPYERWAAAVCPEDLAAAEGLLAKVIEEKGQGSAEFRILWPDGTVRNISAVARAVLDKCANVDRLIGVNIDVTERQAMALQITHSSEHDFLTGLPNRALLNDRFRQGIALALRHERKVAVLFLDLDGFKHINDSLGHPMGDKVLQSVAVRLEKCVRIADTVSRQGGDEFVVLLLAMERSEDAVITARRMLQAVAEPHSIDQHELHVTASIGVSIYPDDGQDAETLIKNADTAMYQAKETGRHSYQFFKPSMNVKAVERQSIEESLRRALERQEFTLHYQPKINLATSEITGAEALIRWTHPIRGPVSPAQFIPVAEDCGLILPIGNWVIREACRQAQAWLKEGLAVGTMAVNVSGLQLRAENFLDSVGGILKDTAWDPRSLELELTESVLMKHVESTESILRALRAKGIQLAVDDFGTGYSSLSYLRRFPIDTIKIDQSFIHQINTVPDETTIVAAVISMGRSLNLRVVAEGVETLEELAFLRAHRCDEAQGYYFSRPVPPMQFATLLESGLRAGALPLGVKS